MRLLFPKLAMTTITTTTILLARHAQTDWSRDSRYTGTSDVALTGIGRDQAAAMAKRIATLFPPVAAIYSSALLRSVTTAEIIAEALSLAVENLPQLNELNYGLWEGLTPEEVRSNFPADYKSWEADPASKAPPRGETGTALVIRAEPTLLEIAASHHGTTIVIVGHKALNRLLICSQIGIPLKYCRRALEQDEACLNVLRLEETGMRLIALNDTSHYRWCS